MTPSIPRMNFHRSMNAMPAPGVGARLRSTLACWAVMAVLLCSGMVTPAAGANRADDLARIHLEALGGPERVAALASLRATGHVLSGGKRVGFHMIAARPAKLRLEIESGGRTLVQAY